VAIDWDETGEMLRSNCAARELRYLDAATAEPLPAGSARGRAWADSACPLSGDVVAAADRSAEDAGPTCAVRCGGLAVVGDESGGVSVYAHPADVPGAERRRVGAHGDWVAGVAACGDDLAASVGAEDGAVIVWTLAQQP